MERFWEIDFLRGIAIIMMIAFHLLYDLNFFGGYTFSLHSGFWWLFARITAFIFIFLVGVSLTISYSRVKKKEYSKFLIRGLKIFSYGLFITLITWIFLGDGFIVFGILHFIGLSIIIAYPFIRLKIENVLLGISLVLIGIFLSGFVFDFPWLLWLGLIPEGFYTFDYFPLLPWFGIILIGLFFGNLLYPNGKRRFAIKEIYNPITGFFCFLGRHSLKIYLIHQPILVALLYVLVF